MSFHFYNHLFSIDPDNGELRFIEAPTQSVYEGVYLFASDGINLDDTIFNNVVDENEAPTSITLDASNVTENDIGGHIANITGADPNGDWLTYSVLSSHDGDMLEIDYPDDAGMQIWKVQGRCVID